MDQKIFRIHKFTKDGSVSVTCEEEKDLVTNLKDCGCKPEEANEIGSWGKIAQVGDTAQFTRGVVFCISGETFVTSEIHGQTPVQMIVWVQEWDARSSWSGPSHGGYSLHEKESGSESFFRKMRAREARECGGETPEDYLIPNGKPYKTLLLDTKLIKEVLKDTDDGVWVQKKPPEVKG